MANCTYRIIIILSIVFTFSSTVFGQSMNMEDSCSAGMIMGSIINAESSTAFGITGSFSPHSIVDLSFGFGITNIEGYIDDPSYFGFSIMLHPSRISKPRNYSIAPLFSFTHTNSTDYTEAANTSAFGGMGYYRVKFPSKTYFMLEAGISRLNTKAGYNGKHHFSITEYTIGVELFARSSDNTMVTVNPAIVFVEDEDPAYGIAIGLIFSGKRLESEDGEDYDEY
jgi:hypothetical protein